MPTDIFTIITDIALGSAALKVAWSADRATKKLNDLLSELTRRIEKLEDAGRPKRRTKRKLKR